MDLLDGVNLRVIVTPLKRYADASLTYVCAGGMDVAAIQELGADGQPPAEALGEDGTGRVHVAGRAAGRINPSKSSEVCGLKRRGF